MCAPLRTTTPLLVHLALLVWCCLLRLSPLHPLGLSHIPLFRLPLLLLLPLYSYLSAEMACCCEDAIMMTLLVPPPSSMWVVDPDNYPALLLETFLSFI
ncbi:hypothetical protein BKA83DRAFT_4167447 [Pisolithus microcarpus]|nr:hypothetical protein BKA83DRAFT_4167447 [Pisolithus microcarpus]